jgi:septum formation protein
MSSILFLASKSASRQMLLRLAKIPFVIIDQQADEAACDWTLSLEEVVTGIALFKMKHALVPPGTQEGQCAYILTADTLVQDVEGILHGKSVDREDAKATLRIARRGNMAATAFCIEKRVWSGDQWRVLDHQLRCVKASYRFAVPEDLLDYYLDNSPGGTAANATAVEEFGLQFLEYVNGSYSTIVGLPLFEVREVLAQMGFFN